MSQSYKIYYQGGRMIIERVIYPRFRGVVTFGELSDIEEVEFTDACSDPSLIARVMREAGDYLVNHKNKEI